MFIIEDNLVLIIVRLYINLLLDIDDVVYGKGVKCVILEKIWFFEYLVKKVKVLVDFEVNIM